MTPVAVVLCAADRLGDRDREAVAGELRRHGAQIGARRALDAEQAEEWEVDGPLGAVRGALRDLERPGDLDLVVRPIDSGPAVFLADLESTIIRNEMLDELAELAGVGDEVAAITARAMNGELDFRGALAARLELLRGQPVALLEAARERTELDPGARTLIATLRARGCRTALVSGGFSFFADPVARELGFDEVRANRLVCRDGRIAGGIEGPLIDRAAKKELLGRLCTGAGCGPEGSVAVGDGANDLGMLRAAGLGISWRGKPRVASEAPARLTTGDLTTVLLALGIARSEWVEDEAPDRDRATFGGGAARPGGSAVAGPTG